MRGTAVSLGFGVLFATAITLVLVPTLYAVVADLERAVALRLGREEILPEGAVQPPE